MKAPSPPAGAANTVVVSGSRLKWADVLQPSAAPPLSAFLVDGNDAAVRAVGAHVCDGGRETLVVARSRVDAEMAEALRADGFALVEVGVTPAGADRDVLPGRVWLLTSGSTGRPKRVAHSLASLTTVAGDQPPRRWLNPYSPGTYAWWQLVSLSLSHPGQDLVFVESGELDSWPEIALAEGVTAVSGTPTFWRQSLWRSGETVGKLGLQQITLGGEPVDQAILDRLAATFPSARVTWIYASSEAGATIAVHDRRAGFPVEWLERRVPGRPSLAVDDGELVISSPWSASSMPERIRTGDRADVVDGRVLISGRLATDEVNVGGTKVSTSAVRAVLLAHPAVAWARVRGRRAPLVGQLVVAEVVLAEPITTDTLTAWCAERLPDAAVPRRIRVLEDLPPTSETLKSDV